MPLKVIIQDFGVVMFFILSGFLVTASAMRRETFEEFFIDRVARMFTPYIPCLILIGLAGTVFGLHGPYGVKTFIANALMLQDFPLYRYINVPEIDRFGTGRPLWSVALEWWFYMAFGAFFFIKALPIWALPLVVVGFFVTGFGATVGMLPYTWAAGAIAPIVWTRLPKAPWTFLFAGFLALALYRYRIAPDEFYDLKLNLLMATSLFCAIKALEDVSIPDWIGRCGSAIAAYSYTLYLTHYTVMSVIPVQSAWARTLITFVVANIVAIVVYFAFERHYRKVAGWMKAWLLPKPETKPS